MPATLPKPLINLFVVVGLACIAAIDYVTGIEIRVFPLYFLPLILAAWFLNRITTIAYAVSASLIWALVMYYSGREYSTGYVWFINIITQSVAFLLVSLLVSTLHGMIENERRLSRIDLLTGLSNRRDFFEKSAHLVEICRRNNRPVTLGYIDLDNFKKANDTLGHEHGDELLQAVAQTFRDQLRTSDLCARMGGDEFVVLLPETDVENALPILERIREVLASNDEFSRSGVTASIGAITYLMVPSIVDDMIAKADEMMYRAKGHNKNSVHIEIARTA
ncbi:MAG: GGDEF domain-containing protein [Gammaproteobacteria bacterium]|nr:GGDEF domain-containing protein [Gammaproteobacteria bacterium]MDP2140462.1 GGDEF domain-containing protein [Gammaproteobacteria bacterium]MDP2349501.1 GGDEF domain-containing protein [Gammaproteobacteria bacterium]